MTVDKPGYVTRFEGCRMDQPRRRRTRQSMPEGLDFPRREPGAREQACPRHALDVKPTVSQTVDRRRQEVRLKADTTTEPF
jgi:hypothetical protein